MSFTDAISSGLANWSNFSGRASRPAYWWWALFSFIVSLVVQVIARPLGGVGSLLVFVVLIGLFVPSLAVAVRRLHDTDRSGWWYLIAFVPIVGFIVLLIFFVSEGTAGPNQYGDRPTA